jgi:hypothetical protein
MNLPRTTDLALLLLLAPCACLPDSKSIGSEDTGTDGLEDTTTGGVAEPTSGTEDPSASSSPPDDSTTTPSEETDGWDTATTDATADATATGDTGIAEQCDIEIEVCAQADLSKMEPIDCGFVTQADSADAWIALRVCILEANAMEVAFKGLYELQGIDSLPTSGFVGQAGVFYSRLAFYQDIGGFVPELAPVTMTGCTDIVEVAACDPGVGELCLACEGPGAGQQLCP